MYNFKDVEKHVEERWKKEKTKIKKTLAYDPKKPLFSFLEGPPTANAPPGLHHVEVRVFKDLFCRFKYMQGFSVPRKGGWDCHGLPVEVQIEKQLKLQSKKDILDYGVSKFINQCRESVFSYIKEWDKLTEKMGYWVDLEHAYATFKNDYIESVWWSLKELYDKGLLYEGHKVVPLCPRCETPLSSHEVAQGYEDVTEPSIVVKFQVNNKKNRYFLAFTTTPWTTISNLALAVKEDALYAIVKEGAFEYILAKDLVNKYFEDPEIVEEVKGRDILGIEYEPIFPYFKNKLDKKSWFVIASDSVTLDEGTGIVHMAPAFGEADYEDCKKNSLPFIQPVTEDGKFTSEVPEFKGMFVKKADPEIIKHLESKGIIFKVEKYTHSYPFCWRCGTPLIYYAMMSWFVKTTAVKDRMVELNHKINWYPKHIKEGRFGDWLANVKDWALSRKKFWGTPLPIWRCSCGNEIVVGSVEELKELAGKIQKDLDLHKPAIDGVSIRCTRCKKPMKRVPDVIDCWYDSGSALFAQFHYPFENRDMFKRAFPYDFIAEAIDQTRGWFYTLHALATLLFDDLAYKNVVCAGHILDEKGEKMSKSKGNILNPWEMFDTVGVDAVRLQMCMTEPGDQKRFSVKVVNEAIMPFMNILWNCYVFSKGYLKDKKMPLKRPALNVEDEWILSRLNTLTQHATESLDKHNYHHCVAGFVSFVNEDFSRFYIRLIRDRTAENDAALTYTLSTIFSALTRLLAPFAVYISDYIYHDLIGTEASVHFDAWPKAEKRLPDLEDDMVIVRDLITIILAQRERAKIGIRWPLSHVEIFSEDTKVKRVVERLEKLLLHQTNIKKIVFNEEKPADSVALPMSKAFAALMLDTKITPELEREGYAREVVRRIQDMRKKAGLKKEDRIELFIYAGVDLKLFTKEIRQKVGAAKITFGAITQTFQYHFREKIRDYEFELAFTLKK